MSGILKKLSVFKPKHVTHIINDVEFKFYPVRVKAIVSGEMRKVLSPIVEVVQSVMGGPAANVNESFREVTTESSTEIIKGVSVETLSFMEKFRSDTRERALGVFTSDETRYQIGSILGNSLRDDFPSPKAPEFEDTVKEFMDSDNMDLPTFIGFVIGFLKANASVLGISGEGDLGNRVMSLVKAAFEKKEAELLGTQVDENDVGDENENPESSQDSPIQE